ncbi:hypothetical protein LF1_10170 [Rubripirellula obstinata]|uniref:Uncharacterized protein n=1 Tax=Rubripirellula obstinata TaxID=406547 RepID=A0A5B1CBL8_9BACT|nr:hypothetical protein [Rubripirellula obstinata]KAA1258497.1 hypothetical protein LF1_10170 [Rubripirellula obstinata]
MRNLFIIVILAGVAFTAGWFTIDREGDKTTIQFNRAEIRQDTRRVIDRGREILDNRDQQFAGDQQQPQQDPRYANRNGGFQQQDQRYQQPNFQQSAPQQNGYQNQNQAPWNQNFGRPDPNAYDVNQYQERR